MVGVILFAIVVVGASVWTMWKRLKTTEREDQIPIMAAAKGLHFANDDPFDSKVLAFHLFHQGDGSRLENVVWNEADAASGGTQARVFDFGWYKVHHNRDGRPYEEWHWSSCALAQPDGSWPALQIAHQGLVDKALELVGSDPIHFESEEFNNTFHVTCADRRFASALIDPQMMQFLLETKGLVSFATLGRFVLLTTPQVAPDEMPILLGLTGEFVRRVPSAIWELYPKAGPDATGAVDAWAVGPTPDAVPAGDPPAPDQAWDPTPGVDYDLDGHPVTTHTEDAWHDHPVSPHDLRPPDRFD